MFEGKMMSNGPPAHPDGTVDDARWLFPQEQAPPPRDESCKQNGFGDPALHASNGSPPTPSPPSKSSPPSSVSTSFPTLVKNWKNHVKNLKADMAEMRAILSAFAACARTRQEAADARARQEAVAARDPPGRASQNDEYDDNYDEYDDDYNKYDDDYDEYNDDYDEYNDDKDEYDDNKDEYDDNNNYDEDAEDEYEDIVG
jgi:hypothetical protein